jgi:two-component system, OmpR family, response regulator CpxR
MRSKKVILCVDDNELDLSVLRFILRTNGYTTLSARDGQEAMRIFAHTAVDLVLSNYAMPQMNGVQLIDRLKQIAAHIPMILLGDPRKIGSGSHQADALVSKRDCSSQELLERIRVMSARRKGPSTSTPGKHVSKSPSKPVTRAEILPFGKAHERSDQR